MRTTRRTSKRRASASVIVIFDVVLMLFTVGSLLYTYTASGMQLVPEIATYQTAFWERRASELCVEQDQRPRLMPLPANADPVTQLARLAGQTDQYEKIWAMYEGCQEPKMETINEDLLHFKVNKYDDFESDPSPGFQTIRSFVDQYVKSHQLIYVIGHTDDTFTDEYNYLLSYRRALRITDEIKSHLTRERLQAGKDYMLYPVGMGKSQLVPQVAGESVDDWRKRCRRIEIYFRSSRATSKAAGK
jgi:outer membrane protein OmpA-like peptidoglycan-associated protein